jgi:hypothetical protein
MPATGPRLPSSTTRSGRFDRAHELPARLDLPLARLMQGFVAEPPYRIEPHGEVSVPFLQSQPWELPTVALEIDGRATEAWIDTGGDMLTVPHAFGVEPLATFKGAAYAGGVEARGAYGRAGAVRLGGITDATCR